jgi:hypothetical protein
MPGQPLAGKFVQVTLDGSGNGQAFLGPSRVREHWQLAGVSVKVATSVKEATCDVYLGTAASPTQFLSHTDFGSSGRTCALGGLDIQPGQSIIAVWEGGDANATATLVFNGTYTIGAPNV